MKIHAKQLSQLIGTKQKNPYEYTDRDLMIINGEFVLTLKKADILRLIDTAKHRNEPETVQQLKEMYKDILTKEVCYLPKDLNAIEGGPGATLTDAVNALKKAVKLKDKKAIDSLMKKYDMSEDLTDDKYYSNKEKKIIDGTAENVTRSSVTRLINKALNVQDYILALELEDKYGNKVVPISHIKHKITKARIILRDLDEKYAREHNCKFTQNRKISYARKKSKIKNIKK